MKKWFLELLHRLSLAIKAAGDERLADDLARLESGRAELKALERSVIEMEAAAKLKIQTAERAWQVTRDAGEAKLKAESEASASSIRKQGYHARIVYIEDRLMAAARIAIAEAERVGASIGGTDLGLFKRQQAMQMLSNIVPGATEHDCANAVQMAIEQVRRG